MIETCHRCLYGGGITERWKLQERGNYKRGRITRDGELKERGNYKRGEITREGELQERGNYKTGSEILDFGSWTTF